MSKTTTGAILTIVMLAWFLLPPKQKPQNQQELEIKSLAFSYGILSNSICPNKKSLVLLKHEYMKTIDQTKVSERDWVNNNFDGVFTSECLIHESKRFGE